MSNGCPDKTTQMPPKPPANMLLTFCLPSYSSAILSFSLKNDRNRGKSQKKNHWAMAATTLLTFWCFRVVQCARSRAYTKPWILGKLGLPADAVQFSWLYLFYCRVNGTKNIFFTNNFFLFVDESQIFFEITFIWGKKLIKNSLWIL